MINHHNIILPQFIKPFLVSKFTYDSHIERSFSGKEFIKNGKSLPEYYFCIKSARVTKNELENIINFFRLRRGSLCSFLLEDDADNYIEKQVVDIADGAKNKFKIVKAYQDDVITLEMPINFPDVATIEIYNNDMKADAKYSEDESMIIFSHPPEKDSKIIVTCKFYKRVRLISKNIEYFIQRDGSYLMSDIELREVLI